MKNKVMPACLIAAFIALMSAGSLTSARFYSAVVMSGGLNYNKIAGKIELYHPEWVWGYNSAGKIFDISAIPSAFPNIHYSVQNEINGVPNEEELEYYLRIVAADGTNNLPIEYDVHEFNNPDRVYHLEAGIGYGPFTLEKGAKKEQLYSIKADWTKVRTELDYLMEVQKLKVQMVKRRADNPNEVKVINEAPLDIGCTEEARKFTVSFGYYDKSKTPYKCLKTDENGNAKPDVLKIAPDTTINLSSQAQLENMGLAMPEGYYFCSAMAWKKNAEGNEVWGEVDEITLPSKIDGNVKYIELYCLPENTVEAEFNYFELTASGNVQIGGSQRLSISRGTTINFKDNAQLGNLGIKIPDNYEFYQATCGALDSTWAGHDTFKIPSDFTGTKLVFNMIVSKTGSDKIVVQFAYYKKNTNPAEQVGMQTLSIATSTTIDFNNQAQLGSLGINIPEGWAFDYATSELSGWAAASKIKIPSGGGKVFIEVYCVPAVDVQIDYYERANPDNKKIEGASQKLKIKRGTTINFEDSGSLSALGIVLPSGYKFEIATCFALKGDWGGFSSIQIPPDFSGTSAVVNAILNASARKVEESETSTETETSAEMETASETETPAETETISETETFAEMETVSETETPEESEPESSGKIREEETG